MEKLKTKLHELERLIQKYKQQLKDEENIQSSSNKKKEALLEKIYRLNKSKQRIEKVIEISAMDTIISGELVELYKGDENPQGYYTICLRNTKTIIGKIGCINENNNICYAIDEAHRNNGYGFQAVVILLKYLLSKNIENITIVIEKENVASIKLAEKIKSVFPDFIEEETNILIIYNFTLNKSLNEKHIINR